MWYLVGFDKKSTSGPGKSTNYMVGGAHGVGSLIDARSGHEGQNGRGQFDRTTVYVYNSIYSSVRPSVRCVNRGPSAYSASRRLLVLRSSLLLLLSSLVDGVHTETRGCGSGGQTAGIALLRHPSQRSRDGRSNSRVLNWRSRHQALRSDPREANLRDVRDRTLVLARRAKPHAPHETMILIAGPLLRAQLGLQLGHQGTFTAAGLG